MSRLQVNGIINNGPQRVINISSRKKKGEQEKIRIDKLLKMENPTILIKRSLGGMGDVIMSLPLVSSIKKLIPNCFLVYATDMNYANGSLGQIIQHCPDIDQLISNKEAVNIKYDYCVDITTTGLDKERSGTIPKNRIDLFADEAGVPLTEFVPNYVVTEEEKRIAQKTIKEMFKGRENCKVIGLQPRSNDVRRTWPLEKTEELISLIEKEKNFIILVFDWGQTSSRWKKTENTFPITEVSFSEEAALINECDCIICPDSSILHLAGALEKKTVSLFGPIPPQSRINHYKNTVAVLAKNRCSSFCWYIPKCLKNSLKASKLACLRNIHPEMILEAMHKKLKEPLILRDKEDIKKDKSSKIIIKRSTSGLGDILMALRAIEAVADKYPQMEVHVAVQKHLMKAISNNKKIDKVINIKDNIDYKKYNLILDISSPCARYETIRNNLKLKVEKSRVEIFAEALGVRNLIPNLKPVFTIEEEERKDFTSFIKDKIDHSKKTIFICPQSAEKYRDWPIENVLELSKRISDFNIITNTKGIENSVYITRENSIHFLAAAIEFSDLVLTVDTGPLHIAAALDKKIVALFGPIKVSARCKGYGKNITIIKQSFPCLPCWRNGNIKCKNKKSNNEYSHCLETIKPSFVEKIIRRNI